jgi:hypothetical protein
MNMSSKKIFLPFFVIMATVNLTLSAMQKSINNKSSHAIEITYNHACYTQNGQTKVNVVKKIVEPTTTTYIMAGDPCWLERFSAGYLFEFRALDDGKISVESSKEYDFIIQDASSFVTR